MRLLKLFRRERGNHPTPQTQNQSHIDVSIWPEAPPLSAVESPVILSDTHQLWAAYFQSVRAGEGVAIVRFNHVIDHRLSPINDEGLGMHEYSSHGLTFYNFHELVGTPEAAQWKPLNARHWVLTFKDVTLDVIAEFVEQISKDGNGKTLMQALLLAVENPE